MDIDGGIVLIWNRTSVTWTSRKLGFCHAGSWLFEKEVSNCARKWKFRFTFACASRYNLTFTRMGGNLIINQDDKFLGVWNKHDFPLQAEVGSTSTKELGTNVKGHFVQEPQFILEKSLCKWFVRWEVSDRTAVILCVRGGVLLSRFVQNSTQHSRVVTV